MSNNMSKISSADYAPGNRLWVDIWFGDFSAKSVAKIFAFCALPWLIGFMVCYFSGVLTLYLETLWFYLVPLGMLIATTTLNFGSSHQWKMYDRYLDCFLLDDKERRTIVTRITGDYSNKKLHIRGYILVVIAGVIPTINSFLSLNLFGDALTLKAFSAWYGEDNRLVGVIVAVTFVLFLSWPLATAISMIARMPSFFWQTRHAVPRYPPRLIKSHFDIVTLFYTLISVFWSAGAALLALFFRLDSTVFSFVVVYGLFLLGIIVIITPQVAYVRAVSRSEEHYFTLLKQLFEPGSLSTENKELFQRGFFPGSVNYFMGHDTWVYPAHQSLVVIFSYLVSLVTISEVYNFFFSLEAIG